MEISERYWSPWLVLLIVCSVVALLLGAALRPRGEIVTGCKCTEADVRELAAGWEHSVDIATQCVIDLQVCTEELKKCGDTR